MGGPNPKRELFKEKNIPLGNKVRGLGVDNLVQTQERGRNAN